MNALAGKPRRLSRYVLVAFLFAFAITLIAIVALFLVVDGTRQAQALVKSGRHDVVGQMLRYYALHLPIIFVQIGPVVTLVAAAFALTRLRRTGQLVPILASGVSLHRVLLPVVVFALGMVGLSLAFEQWVIPPASASIRTQGLSNRREAAIYNLLVEDRANGLVVFMGKYTPARQAMENVHVFELADPGGGGNWQLRGRLFAWQGSALPTGGWLFRDGYRYDYDATGRRRGDGTP